ncbi:hypothetical protein B0H11DRAFT_1752164, partial [Mycena galericulata]
YATPLYWKQPYHTSALSGHAWVKELLLGHPDRIKCELGIRLHVSVALVCIAYNHRICLGVATCLCTLSLCRPLPPSPLAFLPPSKFPYLDRGWRKVRKCNLCGEALCDTCIKWQNPLSTCL